MIHLAVAGRLANAPEGQDTGIKTDLSKKSIDRTMKMIVLSLSYFNYL
jgi:hypothetical protein